MQAENELRDAADFLTAAEQVLGGTFLQEIGEAKRQRREADYIRMAQSREVTSCEQTSDESVCNSNNVS